MKVCQDWWEMKNHSVSLLRRGKPKDPTRSTRHRERSQAWILRSLLTHIIQSSLFSSIPHTQTKQNQQNQQNKIWIKWHANTPKAKTSFLKPPIIFTGEYQQGKVTHVHKNAQSKTVSSGLRDLHPRTHALLKHNMTMRFIPKVGVSPPMWMFAQKTRNNFYFGSWLFPCVA